MVTNRQTTAPEGGAREAFRGLDSDAALWQTPEGERVVVWRGQKAAFVLSNRAEWDDVLPESEVELTADAEGRVRRWGRPVEPGNPDWVVPNRVRSNAVT